MGLFPFVAGDYAGRSQSFDDQRTKAKTAPGRKAMTRVRRLMKVAFIRSFSTT